MGDALAYGLAAGGWPVQFAANRLTIQQNGFTFKHGTKKAIAKSRKIIAIAGGLTAYPNPAATDTGS